MDPAAILDRRIQDAVAVVLMVAGARTGLWHTLHEADGLSAAELSQRADLDESYVEGWLSAQVELGTVRRDGDGFRLSPEYEALISEEGSAAFAGEMLEAVVALYDALPDLVRAFGTGEPTFIHDGALEIRHLADAPGRAGPHDRRDGRERSGGGVR